MLRSTPTKSNTLFVSRAALVAALYWILARFALTTPFIDGELGKIIWPASGLALGVLLVWGLELWPAVAVGAFLTTELTTGPLAHAVATGLGNAAEVLVAAAVLARLNFDRRITRARDVVALVAASGLGASISAVCGTIGLYAGELSTTETLPRIFWQWHLGHALGMLVVTPFVLTAPRWRLVPTRLYLETAALMMTLVAVNFVAFWDGQGFLREYSLEYLPFPVLAWAAFRLGVAGAAAANVITGGMAAWSTAAGMGPLASGSASEDMLLTWSFVNVSAVTTLLLAVVVSEEKRAKRERQQSEDRYRKLIEQAADGIFVTDDAGRCTEVNPSGCALLGRARSQILGSPLEEIVSSEDRREVSRMIRELEPGRAVVSEWRLTRFDGSTFPAEVSAKRFDDGRLQAFVRDETTRHALEAQLHESQKMEAVGILAGGIAHDFNNLLTAIIGHTAFVRNSLPDEARQDVDEIGRAAGRAADLTRKLLAFARRQIVEPRVIVLDELVANLETMLGRVLGESIRLVVRPATEPWRVRVDPLQMEQVLLNLTLNARDAMPRGGELTVAIENLGAYAGPQTRALGKSPEIPPGDYVTVVVRDTGIGMDAATVSRVFEPFFTTKERGQGTGLGLAVSYGIVKQASGFIRATSRPGDGSTFQIFLPRTLDRERSEQAESAAAPWAASDETILLVEDETLVRNLAFEVLRERGYEVLAAASAEEALRIAEGHPSAIHIAVTDVVLPGMSGKELSKALERTRPELKVLFMSGYAEEEVVHHGVVEERLAFLSKPFTPDALTAKVRAVLDQTAVTKLPG